MAHWYTADTHFGHDNILGLCKRPFVSVHEMDAAMIVNLAISVQPDDDLWIVGDFGHGRRSGQEGYLQGLFDKIPGPQST